MFHLMLLGGDREHAGHHNNSFLPKHLAYQTDLAARARNCNIQIRATACPACPCERLIRAHIDIQAIRRATLTSLRIRNICLTKVERRFRWTSINNIHNYTIAYPANRSTIVPAFVADLKAFTTCRSGTRRPFIAGYWNLSIAFTVVDTTRALRAAPNIRREVANGSSVGAADAGFGTTDCALRV